MKKAVVCKECGDPPQRGAYCMPCWRKHISLLRYGKDHVYTPHPIVKEPSLCQICECPLTEKHPNYRKLCVPCGVKRHRQYQRDMRAEKKPHNPIIVSPKKHIARPAPRIEVKAERVPIPEGMEITKIPLHISRWEHGGVDLWTPKEG